MGRLVDPRKGLITFLDAIELLLSLPRIPIFRVWIIGGDEQELHLVSSLIASRNDLSGNWIEGLVHLWGRVENRALPELYSRSSVLVIPSSREQFGIVAIEAMMCGCPVVASRTGGLKDIVIDGFTGTHFDTDDSSTLANVLSGYIRSPGKIKWQGRQAATWSTRMFSLEQTYHRILRLYQDRNIQTHAQLNTPQKTFREIQISRALPIIERLLGATSVKAVDISCGPYLSMELSKSREKLFGKMYSDYPSDITSVIPSSSDLLPRQTSDEQLHRTLFHQRNALTPNIIHIDWDSKLLITQWHGERARGSRDDLLSKFSTICKEFQKYETLPCDGPEVAQYKAVLADVYRERTLESIERFDRVMASINSRLTGGVHRLSMTHPDVELLRLRLLLRMGTWYLPTSFLARAASALDFVNSLKKPCMSFPKISHGSLKPQHLLGSPKKGFLVCDLDESRYVAGPFDAAHVIYEDLLERNQIEVTRNLRELELVTSQEGEFLNGVAWILVLLVYEAISRSIRGQRSLIAFVQAFLRELPASLSSACSDLLSNNKS